MVCPGFALLQGLHNAYTLCLSWFVCVLQICAVTAQAPFVCDSATIDSVRSQFPPDLNGASLGQSCSQHSSTIISSVSNETAWRYLGCLPEIKSLIIATCSSQDSPNLTLPAEWGAAVSFPNLVELIIDGKMITGTLPEAWGSPHSFPQLINLTVKGTTFLEGPLPETWGSNGSMPLLKSLVMHTNDNDIGSQLPPACVAPLHHNQLVTLLFSLRRSVSRMHPTVKA